MCTQWHWCLCCVMYGSLKTAASLLFAVFQQNKAVNKINLYLLVFCSMFLWQHSSGASDKLTVISVYLPGQIGRCTHCFLPVRPFTRPLQWRESRGSSHSILSGGDMIGCIPQTVASLQFQKRGAISLPSPSLLPLFPYPPLLPSLFPYSTGEFVVVLHCNTENLRNITKSKKIVPLLPRSPLHHQN